jgi:hypothetical protein
MALRDRLRRLLDTEAAVAPPRRPSPIDPISLAPRGGAFGRSGNAIRDLSDELERDYPEYANPHADENE